jgi:hypothetical protein
VNLLLIVRENRGEKKKEKVASMKCTLVTDLIRLAV